jgi:uncharacterized protein (DUF1778 family)
MVYSWSEERESMPAEPKIRDLPETQSKRARIDVRASASQKALLERAAALEGRSLSEFVLAYAQPAAERTIREQSVIALSTRDSETFVEALLNPPEPNERLRTAWERYRKTQGS